MLTIFIGTFNRLDTLERTVDSYKKFKTPHELVIVDNGTDHPKCLELLGRLEKRVKKVYSLPGCVSMDTSAQSFAYYVMKRGPRPREEATRPRGNSSYYERRSYPYCSG